MNRRTHYILAATLIATVVCLDRVSQADAGQRAQQRPTVRAITGRLSHTFRVAVPAVPVHRSLQNATRESQHSRFTGLVFPSYLAEGLPFWFRLPPPVV